MTDASLFAWNGVDPKKNLQEKDQLILILEGLRITKQVLVKSWNLVLKIYKHFKLLCSKKSRLN